MSNDKFINSVLSTVKDKLSFMQLSDTNVLKIINSILGEIHTQNVSVENLTNSVVNHYYKLISKQIDNSNLGYIHKYIEYYKNDDNLIMKLDSFLDTLQIEIPFNIYEQLFKENPLLNDIVSKIINSGYKFDDTISLLEVYCIINNINNDEVEKDLNTDFCDDANNFKYDGAFNLYLKDILKFPLLSADEERKLLLKYKNNGDIQAREMLINCNLRLVVSCAKKYYIHYKTNLQMMDLVMEGNSGLMKAIDKYDVNQTTRLSTYAIFWINHNIKLYIDNSDIVRIPAHVNKLIRKYYVVKEELFLKLGREATDEEIANILGVSADKIERYKKSIHTVVSINQSVGEEEDTELADFIADEKGIDEDFSISSDLKKALSLANLSDREKIIIILRYGLYDGIPRTFNQISDYLYKHGISETQLTGERIRQLENIVLNKLRANQNIMQFRIYYGLEDSNPKVQKKDEKSINSSSLEIAVPIILKRGKIYDFFKNFYADLVYNSIKKINFSISIMQIIVKYNSGFELSSDEENILYKEVLPKIKSQLLICIGQNNKNSIDVLNPDISFYKSDVQIYSTIISNLKLGNYIKARMLLNCMNTKDKYNYFKYYGLLERLEGNYKCSMEYYNRCLEFDNNQPSVLIELANLNIQIGNHDIGRKMLESLFNDECYSFKAGINEIYLDILEGEYTHATNLLNQMYSQKLSENELYIFNFISCFLNIMPDWYKYNYNYPYIYRALLENYSDLSLLQHLSKDNASHFVNGLDYKKFLHDIQDKLKGLNGNHYTLFDMYKLHLDRPIGYSCNTPTNDVCICTKIGTKRIIDIKPIILSKNYDLSDNLHSEKLKLKRMEQITKNN